MSLMEVTSAIKEEGGKKLRWGISPDEEFCASEAAVTSASPSCFPNPTTWEKKLPYRKNSGLSFYNTDICQCSSAWKCSNITRGVENHQMRPLLLLPHSLTEISEVTKCGISPVAPLSWLELLTCTLSTFFMLLLWVWYQETRSDFVIDFRASIWNPKEWDCK